MPFVRSDKLDEVRKRMERLGILEEDLTEKFIHGSGRGGQKLNKTASCVYIKHEPTGIEVKVQQSRSREVNRFIARRILCEKIKEQRDGIISKRESKNYKIRKQKARRSRRSKEKMLEEKRMQSKKKSLRGGVNLEE
ncbi:peptide chain release factor-like protein [bacterium]|nr:peptide chain release factor-like protein [bacterium]